MGTMAIPDHTGHTALHWDVTDGPSVERARRTFDELRHQRLVPFARHGAVGDFTQLRTFDAAVDDIVWVRPLQGG